ncbi:MAG TPA: FHA domain-containing protein [Planctomycetota bacterium]|nr:FHA domain-containing protein [Planctomycetota bacterium]
MSEQIEITDANGGTRIVPVHGDRLLLGSARDADVCVADAGLDAHHLRFVRAGDRVRVEPVRPGGTVTVNGESLFCKDLEPDDTIEVGRLRLRWCAPKKAPLVPQPARSGKPAAAPAAPRSRARTQVPARNREAGSARAERVRPARRRGVPTWVPASTIFCVIVIVAVLVLRSFADSTWPSSPQHYVDLAREQLGNQQPQRALDTLAFALPEATGKTREEALALEAEIRRMLLERDELPMVLQARQEHDLLQSFVGTYLQTDVTRPAAREFVRLCDHWLERYRALCTRNSDGKPLLAAIESQRSRFVGLAAMDQPESAEDVIFAARSRLRFVWRDYKAAMQRLDAFLQAHGETGTVRREREQMLIDGEQWLRGKLRNLEFLLDRGDRDNAEKDLAQLERWSLLPEWEPLVADVRQRVRPGH